MQIIALLFRPILMIAGMLFAGLALAQSEPGSRDGQVRSHTNGEFTAWDEPNQEWLAPLDFWKRFAERGRGRAWPQGNTFPPYRDVSEYDTFLYEHARGPCLMVFFHQRWRRGNAVWRWGQEFNEYGGCPYVFDD